MPEHPLQDLAWEVDGFLTIPAVKKRFTRQINEHIDSLRSLLPPGTMLEVYGIRWSDRNQHGRDASLGWLTAQDDENLTIQEEYALLGALRECVYKGHDRLVPWSDSYGMEKYPGSRFEYWDRLKAAVSRGLTEEHRDYIESWLRDVRLDLNQWRREMAEEETLPTASADSAVAAMEPAKCADAQGIPPASLDTTEEQAPQPGCAGGGEQPEEAIVASQSLTPTGGAIEDQTDHISRAVAILTTATREGRKVKVQEIALAAGCHRGTLSRDPMWRAARAAYKKHQEELKQERKAALRNASRVREEEPDEDE